MYIGQPVRIWSECVNYGLISKINKRSFAVVCQNGGRRLYMLDRQRSRNEYWCKSNVFHCDVLETGTLGYLHAVEQTESIKHMPRYLKDVGSND